MVSEARRRANDKYTAKCDRIMIKPLRSNGALIRQAANDAGQSLQGYILQAIKERMERDRISSQQADNR